jgi:hypothetical protein
VSSRVCLDFVIRLFCGNFFTLSAFAFGSHIPVPSVQHTHKIFVCVIVTRYFVSPSVGFVRGRADKFCLHLKYKMNGKRYFNEIKKKKYAYIIYFQSCIIIFLQNHHALQYTSTNAALVF